MFKRLIAATCACLLLAGCATYYRVTDLSNGKHYYTQKIKEKSSGAVVFDDSRTGTQVTLLSTDVAKVSKEEFTYGDKGDMDSRNDKNDKNDK